MSDTQTNVRQKERNQALRLWKLSVCGRFFYAAAANKVLLIVCTVQNLVIRLFTVTFFSERNRRSVYGSQGN